MILHKPPAVFSRPELPFAAGVICGCACGELRLLPFAAAFILMLLIFRRSSAIWMLSGFFIGAAALLFHTFLYRLADCELPPDNTEAVLVCRAADIKITRVNNMPEPGSFSAEVLEINGKKCRYTPKITVYPGRGKYLPLCGEIFSGSGYLDKPDPSGSYGRYLEAREIHRIWRPSVITPLSPPSGIMYHICRCRDILLERLIRDVRSDRARALAGAMFFGTSGGFDRETRSHYLNSGTIHLFSISGMHLTAVAALIMAVLFWFPLRLRYILLALAVTAYAVSTGANPPVMRALIVILLWIFNKLFFLSKNTFDLLCIAASAMFVCNPFLVGDMGTQYSFFITAILILSGYSMMSLRQTEMINIRRIPDNPCSERLHRAAVRKWRLLFAAGSCLAAFTASIGISAASHSFITPGSVLMNLVLLSFVPLLFVLAGIKLLTGGLLPGLIEWPLLLMDRVCAAGSGIFTPLNPAVGYWIEPVLFSAALMTAVGPVRKLTRIIAASAAVLLLGCWLIRPLMMKPEIAVISAGFRKEPVIVIAEPKEGLGFIINASSYDSAGLAARFLLDRGIRTPEVLMFSNRRAANASGIGTLLANTPVKRIRLPEKNSKALVERLVRAGAEKTAPGGREAEFIKIFKEKSTYRLEYFNPGSKLSFRMKWCDTAQGRFVSINGGPVQCIKWKKLPEVAIHGSL